MANLAKVEQGESAELIAKIALTGNLAPLTEEQRWDYYQAYCRYLGLDPITRPFDILTRTEKDGAKIVTLYANASCSSQIADLRGVNYGRPEIEFNDGVGTLTVWVKATLPSGRERWGDGVVHIQALGGKGLENALKKATTQAHRRATLALCGISMPDESEIEDIPAAQTARIAAPIAGEIPPAQSLEDRIDELLRAAGSVTNETTRNFVIEWLKQGAFQVLAEKLKCNADDLAREFGYLRREAEAAQSEQAENQWTAKNRAHSPESLKRFNAVCKRLTDRGETKESLLAAINGDEILPRKIQVSYELTDQEVATVCDVFEPWAAKLEARMTKKAEV